MPPKNSIKGRNVILVEDILDTGLTLSKLVEMFKTEEPASLEVAVFCQKPECIIHPIVPKYLGMNIAK
jgi:hypoxanthine phosphoribosyltransferase